MVSIVRFAIVVFFISNIIKLATPIRSWTRKSDPCPVFINLDDLAAANHDSNEAANVGYIIESIFSMWYKS